MKLSSNLSFKGVELIGSYSLDNKNASEIYDQNTLKAEKRAETLKNEGRDYFVIDGTNYDYKGEREGKLHTFVLTDEHARLVNKFDEIKKDLHKMFQPLIYTSDRFVNYFNRQNAEIEKAQLITAVMIAQNLKGKQNKS